MHNFYSHVAKISVFLYYKRFVFFCSNSDFEEVFNLQSQLTELQLELDIMQLLQSYGIEKAVGSLHENKNNAQFQKDTLTAMVNTKINS